METITSPDNTGKKQAGQFKKGASGNPTGRPQGARNKTTLAVQALLEGEAETITRQAIEMAKAGDMAAIKLVLERLLPPRKDMPVSVALPEITTAEHVSKGIAAIVSAVAAGEITPSEGQALAGMLETLRKSLETQELEKRIMALENTTQTAQQRR